MPDYSRGTAELPYDPDRWPYRVTFHRTDNTSQADDYDDQEMAARVATWRSARGDYDHADLFDGTRTLVYRGGELTGEITAWGEEGRYQHDGNGQPVVDLVMCGTCGRSWNDALITSMTPVPSGRCPFEAQHDDAEPAGPEATTVALTSNCVIILDDCGFYAQCQHCPYVSEYTPSKSTARRWATAHDEDQPGDHRA